MVSEFSGRPMTRIDDHEYWADLKECTTSIDVDVDPRPGPDPSLTVRYQLITMPGGLGNSIESARWQYQQRQPDRSVIRNTLELGDEATSWVEQKRYTKATALVRDETLLINASILTDPGMTDSAALETLTRRIATAALAAAAS